MSVYTTKDWLEVKPYFVSKIKDENISLKSFIDEYLQWMKKPKGHRLDAYAIIYREVLGVDKNGKNADPSLWGSMFDRITLLHNMIMDRGSIFAKVISCEGLAHRYVDLYLFNKDKKNIKTYEDLYEDAHQLAIKGKYWKNVDSSMYWLGIAYSRCGFNKKAVNAFCRIKNRKGERYKKSPAYQKKMKYARNCCKKKRVL
ncbi:hypothetical protein CMI47_15630 [Candidatus Pacearchaeota archaeon]|nr:hypothetical protein [Candidatus Pacearchaeota archaeon]